jgi:hypothetical protein
LAGGQGRQLELAVCAGGRFGRNAVPVKADFRSGNGGGGGVAKHSPPDDLRGLLSKSWHRGEEQHRKYRNPKSCATPIRNPASHGTPIPLFRFQVISTFEFQRARRWKKPSAMENALTASE